MRQASERTKWENSRLFRYPLLFCNVFRTFLSTNTLCFTLDSHPLFLFLCHWVPLFIFSCFVSFASRTQKKEYVRTANASLQFLYIFSLTWIFLLLSPPAATVFLLLYTAIMHTFSMNHAHFGLRLRVRPPPFIYHFCRTYLPKERCQE